MFSERFRHDTKNETNEFGPVQTCANSVDLKEATIKMIFFIAKLGFDTIENRPAKLWVPPTPLLNSWAERTAPPAASSSAIGGGGGGPH